MTKERAWPVKAMYILVAAALAMGLIIMATPARNVSAAADDVVSEWDRVSTPTTDGWLLAPDSTIIDYALASDGKVAYAIVRNATDDYLLLKSDNHAATWDDITAALEDPLDEGKAGNTTDDDYIDELRLVATDWDDPDFVAVALWWYDYSEDEYILSVFISTDGGDNFEDAGEVEEDGVYLDYVSDLIVSPEVADKREIAIGGDAWDDDASQYVCGLFRCTVKAGEPGDWEDATQYLGWDDNGAIGPSWVVTDLIFSPNWGDDDTIMAVTVAPEREEDGYWYGTVYLQSGTFGKTSGTWNKDAGFSNAVKIKSDVYIPIWLLYLDGEGDARGIAGVVLPSNYLGTDTSYRVAWVWVNYFDEDVGRSQGEIRRVINNAVYSVDTQIPEMPWLTNVSYVGDKDHGKAIAGVLADSADHRLYEEDLIKDCCPTVNVWRNDGVTSGNMEICCKDWLASCKPPTGQVAMAVSYVSDDPTEQKAYAVALQGVLPYDEGAWSVTFDGGDTWNQLSLIDTSIDYLSDVAVSPDCNKMMLVSVNIQKVCIDYEQREPSGCDSVWLKAGTLFEAEEYNGKWLRTWSGKLVGDNSDRYGPHSERGLLRLAPEELEDEAVKTVYLVDRMTGTVYWNDLETLSCWKTYSASTEIDDIVDLAVSDASTIYALGEDGMVALSDDHGRPRSWSEAVDSKIETGYTIAVWGAGNATHVLVGGEDGDVSYSDDGGETFALLETEPTIDGLVTVAFDTYFDTNRVVYAATALADETGIYRWIIDESEAWKDLRADPDYDYTGLVVDRPNPRNPMTSAETGGVIYASYVGERCLNSTCWSGTECWTTGVARRLYPAEEKICGVCGEWDYLTVGLPTDDEEPTHFIMTPDPLEICGCLDQDSNSKLFAIGMVYGEGSFYDLEEAEWGTVWTFEDCYAKKAPEITYPDDGAIIAADPCSCYSVPFTILWDRLCDACSFDIQFALDEEFDMLVQVNDLSPEELIDIVISGDNPSFSILGGEAGGLSCETTYYVQVRAANAENCQIIHSWWSEPIEITIAPSVEAGIITLVAPAPGALNQPTKNVGFSWDLQATVDSFDWVLSKNADLSSPLDSKTGLTSKATSYANALDHGTTYYWQVKAYVEGTATPIGVSPTGTFTTGATGAFCSAIDGMCFDTKAELEAHNAELAKPAATPFWVWVVIAIGAVLVIVVIVLIFRTRRV